MSGLVVDNFAGGGGASTGIEMAIGRSVDIAINHDPDAIAMHRVNRPATKHYCEDVWQVDPVAACAGVPVALAWFSPDCTHFSRAGAGEPAGDVQGGERMSRYIDAEVMEQRVREAMVNSPHMIPPLIKFIRSIPTADVKEVRRAVWLPILESEITGWNPEFAGRDPVGGYICSICKNEAIYSCNDEWVLSAFCPYCGAKMDEGGKS